MKTTAYDVAVESGQEGEYRFSMDPAKVAAALRGIIEEIESGKLLMQRATFETEAKEDDYTMTRIYLMFAEKQTQ